MSQSAALQRALGRAAMRRTAGFIAKGVLGAGVAYAVVDTYRTCDDLDDFRNKAIFRFGRASLVVNRIIIDYKWSLSPLRGLTAAQEDAVFKECHQRAADRLLELCRVNGGLFIKVGQHIAAMEYLIPEEFTKTLGVLMARAPEDPIEDIKYVVEKELGAKVEDVFSEFSEKPCGAASLAQVHIARLKLTGERVAVKVQRKRVMKNALTDMDAMEWLFGVCDRLFPEFKMMWLVKETRINAPNELNFLHEAENADRVRKMFAHFDYLKVPEIRYEQSTPRVLTMEFCEGAHINDVAYIEKNGIDKNDLVRKIARVFSEMIFVRGVLHSDPHHGNLLVRKNKHGNTEVVLLDHGLYLNMDDSFRKRYTDLWLALLKPDQDAIKRSAREMGVGELYGLFACIVTRRSWKSVTSGVSNSKLDSSEKDELRTYAGSLIPQITEVLHRMPREMLLILKTNDLMRALEYTLGTQQRSESMIEMSKCVARSWRASAARESGWAGAPVVYAQFYWTMCKIYAFEWWLGASSRWL